MPLSTERAGTLNVRPRLPGLNAPSGVRWTVSGMGEEDSERVEKQRGEGGWKEGVEITEEAGLFTDGGG